MKLVPEALKSVWLSRNWDPGNQPKPSACKQTGGLPATLPQGHTRQGKDVIFDMHRPEMWLQYEFNMVNG